MHTSFVLAAAFASVVAAQSSTAAGSTTTAAPSTGDAANAFMIPESGSLGPFSAGEAVTVSWSLNGAPKNKPVTIELVYGPSSALTTGAAVYTADSNEGAATFTIKGDSVPTGVTSLALAISEEGVEDNYSGQVPFSGAEGEAESASGSSAEPSATETGASTLETVASTGAEPTATDSFSGNSTVTGGANTAIETESSSLPTETESGAAASASATGSGASVTQVSFAALFAGLVATVFAL